MSDNRINFISWYAETLNILYGREEAGFPILIITFPLLERYLTNKKMPDGKPNRNKALLDIFPELHDVPTAKVFWDISRNSLLHNVSLSRPHYGKGQPSAWITHGTGDISIDSDGNFWINPVDFSKRVVQVIEADFSTFEGEPSSWGLPIIQENAASYRSGPAQVGGITTWQTVKINEKS